MIFFITVVDIDTCKNDTHSDTQVSVCERERERERERGMQNVVLISCEYVLGVAEVSRLYRRLGLIMIVGSYICR